MITDSGVLGIEFAMYKHRIGAKKKALYPPLVKRVWLGDKIYIVFTKNRHKKPIEKKKQKKNKQTNS